MYKVSQTDEEIKDKIADIIAHVGLMIAGSIPANTIRFYVITEAADLPINGLEKTVLIGTLEETITKLSKD